MEFEKIIRERFSVRSFRNEKLPEEVIIKILNAGLMAPTGCNYQPHRILVINSDEAIEKLKSATRCHFDCPTAFLICHNTRESWVRPYDEAISSPVDGAIVATYMMLQAQSLGVGCCWVMHFNPHKIKRAYNIPEGVEPLALLVMGYPSEDAQPLKLHYDKRPSEEIIFRDSF